MVTFADSISILQSVLACFSYTQGQGHVGVYNQPVLQCLGLSPSFLIMGIHRPLLKRLGSFHLCRGFRVERWDPCFEVAQLLAGERASEWKLFVSGAVM